MANGVTRMVNAELYKGKIVKGRGLSKQLVDAYSQGKLLATKPENQPKKKAKK
jgi:hypothetical protein